MNSPTPTTCWTTWPSGSSPNAALRRPGVGVARRPEPTGVQSATPSAGMMIIANQPIDSADPPVPPRSDNYLHYTGDVGGALGVRRPHRVQRIGIETHSSRLKKAPATFTAIGVATSGAARTSNPRRSLCY
jgi:hypothetical protein